jgi:hypothetical protein
MTEAFHREVANLGPGARTGAPMALLAAHGFKLDVLISIVSAGLATAAPERVFAAGKPVEVTRNRAGPGNLHRAISGVSA